jgi:predicted DNA-binding protein (MmcQ/YjbR family)
MPDVEWVRRLCLSFPDATEDMPWEDTLCFKVRGKIFAMVALSEGRYPGITLKCAPEAFNELLEIEGISPARYVGRYKWATLASSNVLPANELEDLIGRSYSLVAGKAPKKKITAKKSPGKRGKK